MTAVLCNEKKKKTFQTPFHFDPFRIVTERQLQSNLKDSWTNRKWKPEVPNVLSGDTVFTDADKANYRPDGGFSKTLFLVQ